MSGVLTFPLDCFVGLAVGAVEVGATGYARQPCVLAYCIDGVTVANTASLSWPHATASWGVIDTVLLFDAAGASLGSLPALEPLLIRQYDSARIPAAGIVATYTKIARPYGTGRFGTFGYGTTRAFASTGVRLERGFDSDHACAPGVWAPGPFSQAA